MRSHTAHSTPPFRALALFMGLLLVFGSVPGVLSQALGPAGPSPANGSASVIAQGVIDVPDSEQVWQVSAYTAEAESAPITIANPTFIMARTTPLLVTQEATGARLRVANGEATFLYPGDEVTLATFGPPDTFLVIELAIEGGIALGDDPTIGSPFQPLAGTRDIDLVRDVLSIDETVEIPEGAGQTLVVGLAGQVRAATGDGTEVPIAAGDIAQFSGAIAFTGLADDSQFVAAHIGAVIGFGDESLGSPPVEPASPAPTELPPTPQPTLIPATPEPTAIPATPEPATVPASPEPADVASPEASTEPVEGQVDLIVVEGDPGTDTDADSLTDAQEAEYGTDPVSADSDTDGVNDYNEVVEYRTDPLLADTDDDGINDFNEIFTFETDPLDIDSDSDILYDGGELSFNSNPLVADTDADGLLDGEEAYFADTLPASADSDGDGINDYNEVAGGTDPRNGESPADGVNPGNRTDTDGDSLTDNQEIRYGTDPANADMDGDGVNDYNEIVAGSDPRKPDSTPAG